MFYNLSFLLCIRFFTYPKWDHFDSLSHSGPGISSSFSDQPFLKPDQSISDIKQDLKVKARNLEKITKERDIACAELNSLKGKIKVIYPNFFIFYYDDDDYYY